MSAIQPRKTTLLNAITATATSSAVGVDNADRLSVMILSSGITSGNGVFTVEVSNDDTNWATYNRITSNVTNTNAQTDTRVASVTLSTNSTNFLFFPPGDTFAAFRVKCVISTDGVYSAFAYVN